MYLERMLRARKVMARQLTMGTESLQITTTMMTIMDIEPVLTVGFCGN